MKINFEDMMHRVNCLASDLDSLYHQAALKLGLSDSVLFVLYLVYENDGSDLFRYFPCGKAEKIPLLNSYSMIIRYGSILRIRNAALTMEIHNFLYHKSP